MEREFLGPQIKVEGWYWMQQDKKRSTIVYVCRPWWAEEFHVDDMGPLKMFGETKFVGPLSPPAFSNLKT